MSIYYKNIRDLAYSRNNILHYFFNYWIFFARSSAWAEWDFEVPYIPDVEKVYKIINALYLLPDEKRRYVRTLEDIKSFNGPDVLENIAAVIEMEKQNLLSIQWIKEVVLLNDEDRRYIFEHEEEKNHGVYECIKRRVLFSATHDSTFRNPDAPIVLKLWNKVIFPAVNFHEITRPSTVSSSPWIDIHNFLSQKFTHLDQYDATLLIGFDL